MTSARRVAAGTPAPAVRTAQSVLIATFAVHALQASAPYGLPALLPFVRADLGGSYFDAALVASAFLVGIVAGSPIAGGAVDAFGVRRSILAGSALATIMLAFVPSAHHLWLVCLLLAVAGIGYSVVTPGTNTAMLAWFTQRKRATAVGIKQTGVSAGGAAAGAFIPAIALASGWESSFHAIALLYGASFALAWVTQLDGPYGPAVHAMRPSLRHSVAAMLAHRPTMLLAADGFLRLAIQYAFFTYLIVYAIDGLRAPVSWSALLYALAHVFGALGRVGWGWVSDRVFGGQRRLPYALIALTSALGFGLFVLAAPLHWGFLLGSVAILGCSAAGFQGVGLSLLAETGGARAGTASGFVNALSFLGAAIMVPLCGQLLDAGASFGLLFGVLAAMSLVTAGITLALPRPSQEPRHAC